MALTVENGTNNGDSLITLAAFKTYAANVGYDISSFDDTTDIEPAIRRASTYISTNFSYQGLKVGGRSQRQAFPRSGMVDPEGWGIDYQTIPREAQDATAEAAYYELENPNGLNPAFVMNERVKSETVGPISTTYETSGSIADNRPILTLVRDLLKPLLLNQGKGSRLTGRANRG